MCVSVSVCFKRIAQLSVSECVCVFEEQIGQQQLLYQSTESIHSTMTADDGSPEKEEEEEENEKERKKRME